MVLHNNIERLAIQHIYGGVVLQRLFHKTQYLTHIELFLKNTFRNFDQQRHRFIAARRFGVIVKYIVK